MSHFRPSGRENQARGGTFESWSLHQALYLPPEWKPDGKYPVIVEYPGNGNFANTLGDKSTGRVDGCKLGYGITAGKGFIWVCLPFVKPQEKTHAIPWWGDANATAAYCRQTVARVCEEFAGDPQAVVLTGFSRGAIACSWPAPVRNA